MPGRLLRGVARTAVVAGTATAVSNRVSRRQANRWTQQSEAQARAAAGVRTATAVPAAAAAVRAASAAVRAAGPAAPRSTGSDRAAEAARRAEEPGDPHRRRVRGAEGQGPLDVGRDVRRMLFLYRPRETWMPFALPRSRTQQAAYNRQLQHQFESTRRLPPAAVAHDPLNDLRELGELHRSGVLTDAEFSSAKARLLAR